MEEKLKNMAAAEQTAAQTTLQEKEATSGESYLTAQGKLPYGLTNDYMFRALLQKNNKVLKHLICAMKHLKPEDVRSAEIANPIMLGEAIDNKTFILDVRVVMNDNSIINFEMQAYTMEGWQERSLLYLCRAFDNISEGEDYKSVKEVEHIGFLDFTLFPEQPEFYATYQLLNVKNYNLYTDKFTLSVVDLNRIDLATQEDKTWHIDYWAKLFKATTWEEIKMIAEKEEIAKDVADTVYQISQDALIREQCRAREDYNRQMRHYEKVEKEYAELLKEQERTRADYDKQMRHYEKVEKDFAKVEKELAEKEKQLAAKDDKIAGLEAEIERLKK